MENRREYEWRFVVRWYQSEVDRLTRERDAVSVEIERLKQLCDIGKAFHDVAVAERDAERHTVNRLRVVIEELQSKIGGASEKP